MRKRIAIIGAGSAGLVTAWLLQEQHEVVVFEAADRPGGHACTVEIDDGGQKVMAELGAEFVFEEGYGGLLSLLDRLGIQRRTRRVCMSMTLHDEGRTFQTPPQTAAGIGSCLPWPTARRLFWMGVLAATAEGVALEADWSLSVRGLMEKARIPRDVADEVLIPMIAASWGVPCSLAAELAAYSVVRVMGLRLRRPPHAILIAGGLSAYIVALIKDMPGLDLRLGTAVRALGRDGAALRVLAGDRAERFDAVVLACDWHNSAALCGAAPELDAWRSAFSAFEDYPASIALHRDRRLMPASRRLWGIANYSIAAGLQPRTTIWSGIEGGHDIFRTWLREGEQPPPSTSHTARYRHIAITPAHYGRQQWLATLQGSEGLWAAGMYTDGVDNHESALRSALRIAEQLAPNATRVRWFAERVSP